MDLKDLELNMEGFKENEENVVEKLEFLENGYLAISSLENQRRPRN